MMMGAICFAVSLRTLAGSSSGPVALFWFRFSSCFIIVFNFVKCKCLHTGHGNLDVNNKMGITVLGTTVKENGLQ